MKTFVASIIITVAVFTLTASGYGQNKLGIGFELGQPTGFAWNYRMNTNNAVDGGIGFWPSDRYRFHIDYLWHSYPFNERKLSLHYGPGAVFELGRTEFRSQPLFPERDAGFGIRGVLGLTYNVSNSPVDLFVEVAPLIIFAPATASDVDVSFGTRFYP